MSQHLKLKICLKTSTKTIRRFLNKVNFIYYKIRKDLDLSEIQKTAGVNSARHWLSTSFTSKNVVFTDEKRFSHNGPDNQSSYQEILSGSLQQLNGPRGVKRQ